MSTADPPSLGTMLRDARERAGLSVNDVAERTRIRSTLIREIEADDFGGCGGNFYARGHVRSIATTLRLDPAPFVSRFNMQAEMTQPIGLPVLPAFEPPRTRGRVPKRASRVPGAGQTPKVRVQRPGPNWTSAMLVAAAVVAMLAIGSFVLATVQKPVAQVVPRPAPAPSSPSAARPTSAPPVTQGPQGGVSLRLRVTTGSSWVRITGGSGRALFQGVLDTGAVKEFSDPDALTVKYGNSRAVSVVLNGEDRGRPNCGNVVCTVRYVPAGRAGG
jgi:cytoskeleton protein RodZ